MIDYLSYRYFIFVAYVLIDVNHIKYTDFSPYLKTLL